MAIPIFVIFCTHAVAIAVLHGPVSFALSTDTVVVSTDTATFAPVAPVTVVVTIPLVLVLVTGTPTF